MLAKNERDAHLRQSRSGWCRTSIRHHCSMPQVVGLIVAGMLLDLNRWHKLHTKRSRKEMGGNEDKSKAQQNLNKQQEQQSLKSTKGMSVEPRWLLAWSWGSWTAGRVTLCFRELHVPGPPPLPLITLFIKSVHLRISSGGASSSSATTATEADKGTHKN